MSTPSLLPPEASWPEHIPFADTSPHEFSASTSSAVSGESTASYIKAYFEHFHPSFPLLHRPTFSTSSSPELLINIVTVIGRLYSSHSFTSNDWEACAQWRHDIWSRGTKELQRMVSKDCSQVRKTWVLQTWILHIIYGTYSRSSTDFDEAKRTLRLLIDSVRELGLLMQGIAVPDFLSWVSPDATDPHGDSRTPYTRWTSYIHTESLKISLYALVFVDSYMFLPANTRSLISPIEFSWELPFPSDLWEARDSQIWQQKITEHFGTRPEDYLFSSRRIAVASLSISTQQLMTESPSPELLAALAASPFTTLCILTNINALVRDFTRCYYQLPPSPSDPSTFHILTQAQKSNYTARCEKSQRSSKPKRTPTKALNFCFGEQLRSSIALSKSASVDRIIC